MLKFVLKRTNLMKPLNKLAAILCLMLTGCSAPGQSDSGSDRETPTAVSPELSNQFVYSIGEDAQGHIWLGTFRDRKSVV